MLFCKNNKMGNICVRNNTPESGCEVYEDITQEEFYKQMQSTSVIEFTQMWVCIDMTASNNNIGRYPGGVNLHDLQHENVYLQAMRSAVTFFNQDLDGIFPFYVFGSRQCSSTNGAMHIQDVQLSKGNIEPMIDIYKHVVSTHTLNGPTTIVPIIAQAMEYQESTGGAKNGEYLIVLVITDGIFHHIEEHKRMLAKASNLPIMFVVIGVGGGDFSDMQMFDDMKCRKIDNFQFVDLNEVLENETISQKNEYFFYKSFMEVPRHFMTCQRLLEWVPKVENKELESDMYSRASAPSRGGGAYAI